MLFALDNWNNNRTNNEIELQILNEIKGNLETDLEAFKVNLNSLNRRKKSAENLLNAVENNIEYNDSLAFDFFYIFVLPYFTPNKSGYDLLKSKGLEFLSNNKLRQSITNLYEIRYIDLERQEQERNTYINLNLEPLRSQYLGIKAIDKVDANTFNKAAFYASLNVILPIKNFNDFKQDNKILGVIASIRGINNFFIIDYGQAQNRVNELIQEIEIEIQNRFN